MFLVATPWPKRSFIGGVRKLGFTSSLGGTSTQNSPNFTVYWSSVIDGVIDILSSSCSKEARGHPCQKAKGEAFQGWAVPWWCWSNPLCTVPRTIILKTNASNSNRLPSIPWHRPRDDHPEDEHRLLLDGQAKRRQRHSLPRSRVAWICHCSWDQDRLLHDLQGAQGRCLLGHHLRLQHDEGREEVPTWSIPCQDQWVTNLPSVLFVLCLYCQTMFAFLLNYV